ncbi:MAG TPA: site-2 protease family protein [Lacipirellulaceae bacterium]|nr:site-2 protease family protein [Lacipirellulaceae bacterium]
MCVIAALDLSGVGNWLLVILQVIAGLGFVIFVHELGHFAVAKACGVKCPKFYLGFDVPLGRMINNLFRREGDRVFGIPIPRTLGRPIQIGETEYGIGILPLGGYVRMLGQDDDPANIAQQLEESKVAGNSPNAKEVIGPDGKRYLIDRRSYLAKSVPQRMAIISAGVVMNVIFAFIFAVIAYKIGVPYNPSVVSRTAPGTPAWQADIRPGDDVIQVGAFEMPSYDDLRGGVMLGDVQGGIPFVIRREGVAEPITKTLFPKQGAGLPRVGIAPPASLLLGEELTALPDTPAALATPALKPRDEIVAVDGQPVRDFAEFSSLLVQHPDRPIVVQVRRGGKAPAAQPDAPRTGGELIDVTIAPRPMKWLGIVMQMGTVTAVQENSPAAGKVKPGESIDRIADAAATPSDQSSWQIDPMTLPEDLRRMAQEQRDVSLDLRPASTGGDGGRQQSKTVVIPLRPVTWLEGSLGPSENDPVVATALGVAYDVLSVIDRVAPESAAAKAGLESGDVVTAAEFIYPETYDEELRFQDLKLIRDDDSENANWPALMSAVQLLPAGAKVKLTVKRGDAVKEATLTPEVAPGYYLAERGFSFEWIERIRIAGTWGEAVERGWRETTGALGMVYRFLSKLGTQVSITTLGGPITIFKAAGFSAAEGPGKLLVFLTMLSANLAVINFLPIPLLDGGHMVFLLWEGFRGRPASEKFVGAMHAVGFVFIITLMLFVLSLDFGLIPRNL